MNKNIVLAGFAATIVTASLTSSLVAGAATTTVPSIKATTSCGSIKVDLSGFSAVPNSNRAIASLDGTKVIDHKFSSTYSFVFYVDNASKHAVKVDVTDSSGHVTAKTFALGTCRTAR